MLQSHETSQIGIMQMEDTRWTEREKPARYVAVVIQIQITANRIKYIK